MSEVLCYKCHANPANYKIRLQLICKACFLKITEHTFRCTLKTSIFPRNGERILICVSGGANSTSLLHLMDTCNNPEKTTKMMKFIPEILFIDDSIVYNTKEEDLHKYWTWVEATYKYQIHKVKIQDIFQDLLQSLPSDYQKRSGLLYIHIHKWIIKIAKDLGISKVVTGESASRISSLVLSSMCKGAGVSANLQSGESSEIDGIKLSRPMRELLDKEVGIYHYLNSLQVLSRPFMDTFEFSSPSIDLLVESFLSNLQSKFPSTTHTLLRTASKLESVQIDEKCELCLGPKDSPLCDLEAFLIQDPRYCYACQHLV